MKRKGIVTGLLVASMLVSSVTGINFSTDVSAAAKAPKLSSANKTIEAGKSFTLKVKKNGTKISKTTWSINKKKVASLSKAGKTSVKVKTKTAGSAKITATIKYKLGKKTLKKKLNCKLTVQPKGSESTATPTTAASNAPTATATQIVVNPTQKPIVTTAPTATPTPKPDYYKYDYFAMFDGTKSMGAENFYVNFVLSDSWGTNTKTSAIESLEFQVDSTKSFDVDLYVSEWECDTASSTATKIATFKTNGTEGQNFNLTDEIKGNAAIKAFDAGANGRLSFGFKPSADADKMVLHDMYVNYTDNNNNNKNINTTGKPVVSHHKAAISVVTCSLGSATTKYNADKAAAKEEEDAAKADGRDYTKFDKILADYEKEKPAGMFEARPKDASAAINDYTSMAKLTEAKGYKFGTCVTYDLIKNDPEFCKLLAHHCDSITAMNEFKAYSLLDEKATLAAYKDDETSMPVMNYEKADFICKWAQDNGLKVRGHALVWDNMMEEKHKWFFTKGFKQNSSDYASNEICRKRLEYYIDQVMTHFQEKYPDVVYCWDVVNEGIDENSADKMKIRQNRGAQNPFYYHCSSGDENYITFTFKCAYNTREKLIIGGKLEKSSDIELVYNDYNVIEDNKRPYVEAIVKDLNSHGEQLCDAVGCQGYLGAYQKQEGCLTQSWVDKATKTIKTFANMEPKVHVQLTEMAMRNFDWDYLDEHGTFAANLFNGLANINQETDNSFTSMSIWAFIDDPCFNKVDDTFDYWQYAPFSGMFDDTYRVKPAFTNAHDILSK